MTVTTTRQPRRFEIKQGDTAPALETTLVYTDDNGREQPLDLTSATGVGLRVSMCRHPHTIIIDVEPASFVADATGSVSYSWQAGDTDEVGVYDVEWVVTFPGANVMTFPSMGFDVLEITRHGGPST